MLLSAEAESSKQHSAKLEKGPFGVSFFVFLLHMSRKSSNFAAQKLTNVNNRALVAKKYVHL